MSAVVPRCLAAFAAALLAAPALAKPPRAPEAVGLIAAGCKGGMNFSHAAMVRNHLGCILVKAAGVDRADPDRARAIADAFAGRLGRTRISSVGPALIARWAADPASGLIAREGYEALRFEDVELPEGTVEAVPFRGTLVSRENGVDVRREVSGAITLSSGVFRLTELEIGAAR